MQRRLILAGCLAAGVSLLFSVDRAAAAAPPNILMIVSEDNGPELGCYGDPFVSTPHLDRFAGEGVMFQKAYVPQAGCSQSRAALLTGLYPHQNGQIGLATWGFSLYRPETPNLVRSLKEAGYRTGLIGKLHINPKDAFPFDMKKIGTSNFDRKNLERYANEAKSFMGESDHPFFLSVNYPDAHRPFLSQVDGLPHDPLTASDVTPLAYFGIDTDQLREQTADYYNCMNRLDSLIGDLLDALRRSGKADDTIVIYLGDHGADLLRGKRTSYEGGTRVPLIIRWPGRMEGGRVRQDLVSTLDLMPTLLDCSGAASVPGLPGRSLFHESDREYLFTEYHTHSAHNYYPQRTVRDARYKLILNLMPDQTNPGYRFTIDRFFPSLVDAIDRSDATVRDAYRRMSRPPRYELYDLAVDPFEFDNLADDPSQVETLGRLRERLSQWRTETKDPMLDPSNVQRLKQEIDACFIDGKPSKERLRLRYTEYFRR